jgi:hypothetical protein
MPALSIGPEYFDRMPGLGRLDLDEIAAALADHTDYEHRWLIDPQTGEVAFWTSDTGVAGYRRPPLASYDGGVDLNGEVGGVAESTRPLLGSRVGWGSRRRARPPRLADV